MSSAYLRLLIFLLAILIPACAFSSPAFLMMYSVYKLNKQSDRGKVKTSNLTPGFEFLIDTIKQKLFIQAATRFATSDKILND